MKASQKKEKKEKDKKEIEVHIIDKTTDETPKKQKGPIRGILGFDEEFDQEELMNQAFSNAGAEEDFIEEVSRSLSPILCSCYDELWLFKLQYIRRMIQARNGIKRGSEWVQETLNYRGNVRIGFSERIVLLVPDFKLCYIILMLKEWIVKAMRCLSIQSF